MDIKIAKFFPIGLAGFAALKELITIATIFGFDPLLYVFPDGYHIDIYFIAYLITFFLKVLFILAAVYIAKLYQDDEVKKARILSGALLAVYAIRNFITLAFGTDIWITQLLTFMGYLVVLFTLSNFVISFFVNPSNGIKSQRQPRQQAFYVPPQQQIPQAHFQAPQQFSAPAGQTIPDQLAALQVLVDNGTLTQAEFKAAKQRIIGGN